MSEHPRLLDLFCGAGGAAKGYQMAGFHVTGVDCSPQPHDVGDAFIQADALTCPLAGFDASHASPPCEKDTRLNARLGYRHQLDLIGPTRELLEGSPTPDVIEN